MSTVVIKVKSKKLKKGDSIPELDSKSQKCIEVEDGDTIKWKYHNDSDITISADTPFNNQSNNTKITGKGQVETQVSVSGNNKQKILSYDIITSDTNTELDPVIIIKTTPTFQFIEDNMTATMLMCVGIGGAVGYLIAM